MKKRRKLSARGGFALLAGLFVIVFFGSFLLGRYPVGPVTLVKLLLSRVIELPQTWAGGAEAALFQKIGRAHV